MNSGNNSVMMFFVMKDYKTKDDKEKNYVAESVSAVAGFAITNNIVYKQVSVNLNEKLDSITLPKVVQAGKDLGLEIPSLEKGFEILEEMLEQKKLLDKKFPLNEKDFDFKDKARQIINALEKPFVEAYHQDQKDKQTSMKYGIIAGMGAALVAGVVVYGIKEIFFSQDTPETQISSIDVEDKKTVQPERSSLINK